ncbi:DUF805 domain-containing protein [Aurantiacibacter xanthus]|uniref:DUF805 domain-containing protein n=2 Tax=Aurantiacibacter xanthus TaxID=1784712 RepID=A0A3A1P8M6_9SPHN|nr:DUF805 domain-containing protein [Aurantiacibacter xanthus]
MDWMIMPLRKYAQFSGRSRRKEFWMFALLNMIVYAVVFALIGVTSGFSGFVTADPDNILAVYSAMFSGVGTLLLVWALAVFIPSIAVTVRRLHDHDMSGWWYLGFTVLSMIPFIGVIASIAFLVILVLPGTQGANRFGPDPKNPGSVDVFN